MFLAPGIRGQTQLDDLLDFSGVLLTGAAAQLALVQQPTRASLFIANTSAADTINLGIGPPRPTATISGGGVTSVTVGNSGIGFAVAPIVHFLGGVVRGDIKNAPPHAAAAHAVVSAVTITGEVITGGAITSITIDDPGAGYFVPPIVYLENPWPRLGGGAFLPSATAGIPLLPGWSFSTSGMIVVPASAVAIFGPTTNDPYVIKVGGLV